MKLKSLIFVCSLALVSSLFASNRHVHKDEDKAGSAKTMLPGYCEIEIRNLSSSNVVVDGHYDDGYGLEPFNIYRDGFDSPHYISLFYHGYCHSYMYLDIETFWGTPVYVHRLVYTGSQITIYDTGLDKQLRAETKKK